MLRRLVGQSGAEKSDQRHRRLLPARRERPPHRRAAEQQDELPPSHSITSSARASSVPFRLRCQRWVVGLVTGGGSQLPLPWSKGTPCCWADAGAGAAPARTAAIVSIIDSLVTRNSFAASALKGNAARRDEVPRPRSISWPDFRRSLSPFPNRVSAKQTFCDERHSVPVTRFTPKSLPRGHFGMGPLVI